MTTARVVRAPRAGARGPAASRAASSAASAADACTFASSARLEVERLVVVADRLAQPVDHQRPRTAAPPRGCARGSRSSRATGSRSSDVTSRKAVPATRSSALTCAPRSASSGIIVPSARKNVERSSSSATPVALRSALKTTPVPDAQQPPGAQEHAGSRGPGGSREPVGRVEEVQRVARRRRVEHEDVELAGRVELVQLGDRGELLRAGDGAGELPVDRVGEDLVARRLGRRDPVDQRVEGALGVEHQRPQSPPARRAAVDPARRVVEAVEPERVGQPPRRVDGDDGDALPAHRQPGGDGGRRGGLADARRGRRRSRSACRAGRDPRR